MWEIHVYTNDPDDKLDHIIENLNDEQVIWHIQKFLQNPRIHSSELTRIDIRDMHEWD